MNVQQNVELRIRTEPNDMLSLVLIVIGLSTTLVSFLLKSKLLSRAVDQQQVQLVQQAYNASAKTAITSPLR